MVELKRAFSSGANIYEIDVGHDKRSSVARYVPGSRVPPPQTHWETRRALSLPEAYNVMRAPSDARI